jgi:hypothetical protein
MRQRRHFLPSTPQAHLNLQQTPSHPAFLPSCPPLHSSLFATKKARMPKASGPLQNLYLYSATGFAPSLKQYKCVSVAMNNAPFAATTDPFNGAENST